MQSAWFLGVLWITQWESWLEVGLIFQIIPVLLIPLQEIVNNVLEEILSWFGGECRAHTSPASSKGLYSKNVQHMESAALHPAVAKSLQRL